MRCRAAWNRERTGDPAAELSALQWSITAMSDTTDLLGVVRVWDRPRAFAAISEVVWSVTIVDATLVRHHPGAYDALMAGWSPAERQLIEETLTGLRFVRNRIGYGVDLAVLVEPGAPGPGAGEAGVTGWTWRPVPAPALASLPSRAQAWEMTRYRAYQVQLAHHTIGEIFDRSVAFLQPAAVNAITDISTAAAR
jgi:hypothetical protein